MQKILALVFAAALAGCLSGDAPPPGDDGAGDEKAVRGLAAEGAQIVHDGPNLTFVWTGQLASGAAMPLGGAAPESDSVAYAFEVDASVGVVTVWLDAEGGAVAQVRDAEGHVLCAPRAGRVCTVAANAPETQSWPVTVTSLAAAGTSYELTATLSPWPPTYGHDPTAAAGFVVDGAGVRGGEPTLAPLGDGRLLVVAGGDVLRWEGVGEWTDVTPPLDQTASATLDPFLVGDPETGRVYVSQLAACQRVSFTDDAGASWTSNPAACGGPDQHHQKLAVGPGPVGRVVHMMTMNLATWLATDDTVITYAASHDDGRTWIQSPALTEAVHGFEARAIGNVAASEDGTIHAISYLCDGFVDALYNGVGIGRSADAGATWSWTRIGPGGGPCEGIDPGIAAVDGAVHAAWWDASDGTFRLWYATSEDSGATWSRPSILPTPGLGSFVFADAAASADRVAVAFLATPDSGMGANQAPGWARWFPYLATVQLGADNASWQVVRLEDHPVQIGQICMDGPQCLDGARNLLDFIDVQLDADGRAYVTYADGCDDECTTNWQSRGAEVHVAVEPTGG
jgi:hypothetical protein